MNRSPAKAEVAAALGGVRSAVGSIEAIEGASILVNATSVGMGSEGLPVPPEILLRPPAVVVDLVYHPVDTPLLIAARAHGARTIDGVGMLVHQAALAFRLWTGAAAPLDAMTTAARRALAAR